MKNLFLDYIDEPKNSIRYKREGLYNSYIFGEENRKVKVILLDVRYFRTKNDILGEK